MYRASFAVVLLAACAVAGCKKPETASPPPVAPGVDLNPTDAADQIKAHLSGRVVNLGTWGGNLQCSKEAEIKSVEIADTRKTPDGADVIAHLTFVAGPNVHSQNGFLRSCYGFVPVTPVPQGQEWRGQHEYHFVKWNSGWRFAP